MGEIQLVSMPILTPAVPNSAFTSRGYASYFSPLQVLTAAENGGAHILGRSGFWRRSEEKIEQDLNETFASFFG